MNRGNILLLRITIIMFTMKLLVSKDYGGVTGANINVNKTLGGTSRGSRAAILEG